MMRMLKQGIDNEARPKTKAYFLLVLTLTSLGGCADNTKFDNMRSAIEQDTAEIGYLTSQIQALQTQMGQIQTKTNRICFASNEGGSYIVPCNQEVSSN